jgi:hypothetical protein
VGPARRVPRRRDRPDGADGGPRRSPARGGARQASLSRFLRLCTLEPLTYQQARAVGRLAGKADHDDIVDVTVVEGAARRSDAIVTSNHTHIDMIAKAARTKLIIERV